MAQYSTLPTQKSSYNVVGSIRTYETFTVPLGQYFKGSFTFSAVPGGPFSDQLLVNGAQVINLKQALLTQDQDFVTGEIFAGPGETITFPLANTPPFPNDLSVSGLFYANT